MKSTRLHLAKGIKLIQRLLKEQASFFASLVREGFLRSSRCSGEQARNKTLRWFKSSSASLVQEFKARWSAGLKLNKNKNNPF